MDQLALIDAAPLTRRAPVHSPVAVYLARLAPRSRRVVAARLRAIVEAAGGDDLSMFPFERLDYRHTAAIRARIAESYAPATARATLAALRGCLKETWRLGLMSAEQYQRAADIAPVKGTRLPAGRALVSAEVTALLAACIGERPSDFRDGALIAVLYSGGLRRSEAVGLDVGDYGQADGSLRVRITKGNTERQVYLAPFAVLRLEAYRSFIGDGPLFVRAVRGGNLTCHRLTDGAVREILRRRCEKAGIAVIAPHSMRRTTITQMLDAGVDALVVSQYAGHKSLQTTLAYDRRGERAKRKAAQVLEL